MLGKCIEKFLFISQEELLFRFFFFLTSKQDRSVSKALNNRKLFGVPGE
jgi:hypothetical protein